MSEITIIDGFVALTLGFAGGFMAGWIGKRNEARAEIERLRKALGVKP